MSESFGRSVDSSYLISPFLMSSGGENVEFPGYLCLTEYGSVGTELAPRRCPDRSPTLLSVEAHVGHRLPHGAVADPATLWISPGFLVL